MLKRVFMTSASLILLSAASASAAGLTMLASAGGSGNTFAAAAMDFTAATGIPVNVIQYPYADVREKQLLELVGQTGAFDVINLDGAIWMPEVGPFLDPIDETKTDTKHLIPSMLTSFHQDGNLVALPMRVGGWVVLYRKDLFDQAGLTPPKTWDEFEADAKALTKDGVYGFAPALKQGNYLVAQWAPFLFSFGGDILNKDNTTAAFNSPQGIKATQFFVKLVKDGLVPPGAVNYEQSDIITAMSQGIAAMALTYSPYYLNMNDPKTSKVAGKIDVSPFIPYDPASGMTAGKTLISGWGFGVAASSHNKEDAHKFIDFVTSDAEQLKLAIQNNNAPTASAVFQNPDYIKLFPASANVLQAMSAGQDRPVVDSWTKLEDILARELSAAVTGSKSVEEALSAAEADVNAELQ
ncbi:MAG TPA: sugar ABC transporter substrate-binding protein [Devosiaceae bacterium]|jgi:multiple sugar transport system substrate-binding protein